MEEREIARQAVHCSGILVIFIVFALGKFPTGMGSLGVATVVSFLSWWTRNKENVRSKLPLRVGKVEDLEDKTHEMLNSLERDMALKEKPYFGAFNYFLGMGIVLLGFPTDAAILAVAIVSISDAVATLVGRNVGEHEIFYYRKKSLEGSIAFFASAFLLGLVLSSPLTAITVAAIATLVESVPYVNDNFSVPIVVAIIATIL